MFKWLLDEEIITQEYFDLLLEYRELRNMLVHDLDDLLNDNFPDDIEKNKRIG